MGPLAGIRIIEMKGIGPGPYAGMLLADMGAEVIVVERSEHPEGIGLPPHRDINSRGKKSIVLDVKSADGLDALLRLVETADVLFEGNRPGVAERLGFGPDVCLQRNPRLVFGRITGWGQSGPLAHNAGHDINYIALTGALAAIGTKEKPVPPLNLVGDYAGGSHFLVMGILAALLDVKTSGKGQVVDAAITDGCANLMSFFYSMDALGQWQPKRDSNLLDGAAPFYGTYETCDQKFMAVGAIEPAFFALLLKHLGVSSESFGAQHDTAQWPGQKKLLRRLFLEKSQQEWCEIFDGTDACVAPVLNYRDAPDHPHNKARGSHLTVDGVKQPAPAPRFSRTSGQVQSAARKPGADTAEILAMLDGSSKDPT